MLLLATSAALAKPLATDPAHHICVDARVRPEVTGTWRSPENTAVFRFVVDGSQLCADAWDSGDGEWFEISGLSGGGNAVVFHSRMPSTDWHLDQACTATGDEMRCSWSGASEGVETLLREKKAKSPKGR